MIESDKMKVHSGSLITELKGFIAAGSSFKAKPGETDDLISAVLLIIRMMTVLKDWDPEYTILLLLLKKQKIMKRPCSLPWQLQLLINTMSMKNLDLIAEELLTRYVVDFVRTIGDEEGKVTDLPKMPRFFDLHKQAEKSLGSVSITLTDDAVQVMYNTDFVATEDLPTRNAWYDFLKELRMFAKKRLLTFDTRNINKSQS